MNHQAWVQIKYGALLARGVQNLKWQPFSHQVQNEAIAVQVPTFSLNLDHCNGILDKKLPGTTSSAANSNEVAIFKALETDPVGEVVGELTTLQKLAVRGEIAFARQCARIDEGFEQIDHEYIDRASWKTEPHAESPVSSMVLLVKGGQKTVAFPEKFFDVGPAIDPVSII